MSRGERSAAHLLTRPSVAALLDALNPAGEETRIVGGAIRNALMNKPTSDIDLATTLLPEQVSDITKAKGWRTIPTGIAHGTVTVLIGQESFEITTLRDDIETDGRHAKVRFSRDFAHDAARRDFTINALSMGRDGVVHDYFGGKADLAARRVRFIGDAATRLKEDYLRGLRFLRFSAEYGTGALDEHSFAAVLAARGGLKTLSAERVRQEVLKLLMAEQSADIITQSETHAESHGLLAGLLDVPTNPVRFLRLLDHAAKMHASAPDAISRLYALVDARSGTIPRLVEALRLSNEEKNQLLSLSRALALLEQGASPRLLAYHAPQSAGAAMLLTQCSEDTWAQLGRELAHPLRFLITGADLLAKGMPPGPALGQTLTRTEAAWIKAGLPEGQEAQEAIMERELLRIE